jgi:ribosome biogenesis protein YTM1
MAASSPEDVQITCRFVTRLPEKFRIAPTPLAVPGKLTRYGLSEVVNHLLALDPPKPFDFLVDGELVRTSLEKLLLRKRITAEKVLDVEYIPAVGPPSEESVGKHEDWVASIDGGFANAIATGCYDGSAKLWTPGGRLLLTLPVANAANNAVTSVTLLPSGNGSEDGLVLVAGAHDGIVRSWDCAVSKKNGASASAKNARAFVGHTAAVVAVASAPGGEFFASASNDGTARVWRREGGVEVDETTAVGDGNKAGSAKRRKGEKKTLAGGDTRRSCLDEKIEVDGDTDNPLAARNEELVLIGHKSAVTSVQWESPSAVWSGGDDKTLRRWDAEHGRCKYFPISTFRRLIAHTRLTFLFLQSGTQTFDAPKAVSSLACRADGARVAWCGGGDKHVHMWDPRVGGTTGGTTSFASHTVRKRGCFFLFFRKGIFERGPFYFPKGFLFLFGSPAVGYIKLCVPYLPQETTRPVKQAERKTSVTRSPSVPDGTRQWGNKSLIFSRDVFFCLFLRMVVFFLSGRVSIDSRNGLRIYGLRIYGRVSHALNHQTLTPANTLPQTLPQTPTQTLPPESAGDGGLRALVSDERVSVRVSVV